MYSAAEGAVVRKRNTSRSFSAALRRACHSLAVMDSSASSISGTIGTFLPGKSGMMNPTLQ